MTVHQIKVRYNLLKLYKQVQLFKIILMHLSVKQIF